jgi:hypothetical protein
MARSRAQALDRCRTNHKRRVCRCNILCFKVLSASSRRRHRHKLQEQSHMHASLVSETDIDEDSTTSSDNLETTSVSSGSEAADAERYI